MQDENIYRWVTHGRSSCATCEALNGREMSLADWRSRVLPGIHLGCDCSLEALDDLHAGKRVVRTALKMSNPAVFVRRLGVDKRLSHSHGALKPLLRAAKASLPQAHSRPRVIQKGEVYHGRGR
jgi:hypothetical protein